MRKVATLIIAMLVTTVAWAQKSQDFASKFMTLCKSDTTVRCVTVSPKMMEQLVGATEGKNCNTLQQAMTKLKSARIVKAEATHLDKAYSLLKRNQKRFMLQKEYTTDLGRGTIYSRKNREGETVELVLLQELQAESRMVIVNLTGTIDKEFISMLSIK